MSVFNLHSVPVDNDSDISTSVPYFLLILKIFLLFVLFTWVTCSLYLNSMHINTMEMYPSMFDNDNEAKQKVKKQYSSSIIGQQPDATIGNTVGSMWWLSATQYDCYKFGGFVLHHIFSFLKKSTNAPSSDAAPISGGGTTQNDSKSRSSQALIDLFLFLKWFVIFGLGANIIFCSLIGLVGIVTIPGFIAGLVAFKNNAHAYKLTPAFVFLAKCAILFVTFLWMCTFGWIPLIFPFIWCIFHLLYLMFFKQLKDDSSRFADEFIKRMGQLVYIFITLGLILALASEYLSLNTKIAATVAFFAILIIKILIHFVTG